MKKSIQNFLYGIKLFLIVLLASLFLASIEIAPYQPLLFIAVALMDTICIRLLWKSLKNSEVKPEEKPSTSTRRTYVNRQAVDPKHAA